VQPSANSKTVLNFASGLDEARKLDAFYAKSSALPNHSDRLRQQPFVLNTSDTGSRRQNRAVSTPEPKNNAYTDRIQMDELLARPEFRIKSYRQVFQSALSFFGPPPDKACKYFVAKRLPKIYNTLEQLVTTVRLIFPRSDQGKNTRLREESLFAYKALNVIRRWNIARIASVIGFLQNHPSNVYLSDLKQLARLIYRPLFILDAVDADEHIPFILAQLYRLALSKDGGNEEWKKNSETVMRLYEEVTREIGYMLYPLLMNMVCKKWCNYATLLTEHRQKIYAFLELKEEDCIVPPEQITEAMSDAAAPAHEETAAAPEENDETRKLKKVMRNGLETLELLFPGSGWNQPESFPDFYQYFVHVFNYQKGIDCIHPQNPVLQILILSQILQNLFYGWHNMSAAHRPDHPLGNLIADWQEEFDKLIYRNYLKLLAEYHAHFSLAAEFRPKIYGRKITDEINHFTKYTMLPFFDYSGPEGAQLSSNESEAIFSKIDALYLELDKIVAMPDKTKHVGDLSAPFVFKVPTPVSKRLFSLLSEENRSNETLLTMTYEITAVLHYLMNSPDSWAYGTDRYKKIFRSREYTGIIPDEWHEEGVNPDNLFRQSIDRLRQQAAQKFGNTANTETKAQN
jgi:hypothetical protein